MSSVSIQQKTVLQNDKEIVVLQLSGSLDAHSAPQLDQVISSLCDAGKYRLVINFSQLDYISSAGMGLFVGWIDTFRSHEGNMYMAALKPNVLKVFRILGFDKIFGIYQDEAGAIAQCVL
jgi:anti-sigma B factor antagonist